MQVKQRLRITSFVSVMALLVVFGMLFLTIYRVNSAFEVSKIADDIVTASFERLMLRTDSQRTGNERTKEQLIAKHKQVGELLKVALAKFPDSEDKKTVSELLAIQESIGKLSRTIREKREKIGRDVRPDALSQQLEDRLLSQLNMRVYESVLLNGKLQKSGNDALTSALKQAGIGTAFVLLFLGATTLINSWSMGRTIADRVRMLRDGAAVIGGGNLDHHIDIKGDDEFAEISDAFKDMTAKLAGSYRVLENEIEVRKRSEESLQLSEERYRSLFTTLIVGFCIIEVIFDSDGRPVDYRFLEINPAFVAQTGLENAQGRLMRELAPDHEAHWFEIYGKIALTGEPVRFVNEAKALNRWYDVYAYRFGSPEKRQVAIVFNDISERKRAEEQINEQVVELRLMNKDLTRFNKSLVSRELRMIELKKEINELCAQIGQQPRYPLGYEKA